MLNWFNYQMDVTSSFSNLLAFSYRGSSFGTEISGRFIEIQLHPVPRDQNKAFSPDPLLHNTIETWESGSVVSSRVGSPRWHSSYIYAPPPTAGCPIIMVWTYCVGNISSENSRQYDIL